jgi:hypothetical protein
MLPSLLAYTLLGLLLAWPLRRLLRLLQYRLRPAGSPLRPRWRYLRPYVLPAQRGAAPATHPETSA